MTQKTLTWVLSEVAAILRDANVPFCLLGGLAVVIHGHVRATRDVDFLVEGLPGWEPVLEKAKLLGLELQEQHRELADEGLLFLRGRDNTSFGVDILRVESSFEQELLTRTELHTINGIDVPVIGVEDLIVLKLSVGRTQDDADAEALIAIHWNELEKEKLEKLAEEVGVLEKFKVFWEGVED